MRSDAFGPRTWLLAGIAGWAVLAWLLALFGMGGQIRPLADDPSLVMALPKLRAPAPERLGPLAQYGDIGSRPLFSENRKPEPFYIAGEEGGEQARTFDFVLSSVLITPRVQMAILQAAESGESVRLKLGDAPESAPNWRLVEINPRSAVIEGPEGRRTLELRVFDGVGGQAPTPAASRPPLGSPPAATPMPQPARSTNPAAASAAQPAQPVPGDAMPAQVESAASPEPAMTTEQQMDLIRKRIEARRAQLREQERGASNPDKTK